MKVLLVPQEQKPYLVLTYKNEQKSFQGCKMRITKRGTGTLSVLCSYVKEQKAMFNFWVHILQMD